MHHVEIHTSLKTYPVWIGNGALEKLAELFNERLKQTTKLLIIADKHVSSLHGEMVKAALPSGITSEWLEVPKGETAKRFDVFKDCLTFALEKGLDRKSCIIALGGGACGDLAGYVAASFMRGIPFIQVPTTILAHDSAVGGKVAINHPLGKNMIGHFHQPEAVIYDTRFLNTLPPREIRSGFAEVIKHALIADPMFLRSLQENLSSLTSIDSSFLEECLRRGIEIKGEVVAQDEKELGIRAYLNFGHTYGHALEAQLGYGKVTHGEAVVVGMVYALYLSIKSAGLSFDLKSFIDWLRMLGYSLDLGHGVSFDILLEAMKRDKKTVGSSIRFVLLEQVGEPGIFELPEEDLREADQFIRKL